MPGKGRRRWSRGLRIWHLAVAVLAAALAFGAIRNLVRRPNGLGAALCLALVAVGISYAFIRTGQVVAGRTMAALKGWGVRRGGVVGFGAWVVGVGVEVGFIGASIVIGPFATVALFLWALSRLGGP